MEKITKVYDVYEFEELDEEIKQKLIEEEKQQQKEFYLDNFLIEDMQDKSIELLKKYFGKNATFKNVYYSLAYCQGDGAIIEFDLYYYNKFVKIRHKGHYYNKYSFIIDDIDTYSNYLTEKQEKQLKEKIIKMNDELEKYGWQLVDYEISDNEAIEFLKEFNYLKNGEVF